MPLKSDLLRIAFQKDGEHHRKCKGGLTDNILSVKSKVTLVKKGHPNSTLVP